MLEGDGPAVEEDARLKHLDLHSETGVRGEARRQGWGDHQAREDTV